MVNERLALADGDGNINCAVGSWSENWGRHLLQKWVKMKNAVLDCPPAHLNLSRQINQLFRGHPVVWGKNPRRPSTITGQTKTCRSIFTGSDDVLAGRQQKKKSRPKWNTGSYTVLEN